MQSSPSTVVNISSQERIAATLAPFFLCFLAPHLMDKKTDFTLYYMRQGFGLLLALILVSIISSLPLLGIIGWFVNTILWISAIYLAWNAWNAKKVSLPYLLEYTDIIIARLGLASFF